MSTSRLVGPRSIVVPGNIPTTADEFRSLEKSIDFLQKTDKQGLELVPLDLETDRPMLLTDAYLSNAAELKSQLGYVLLTVNDDGSCNIFHDGSNKF